MPTWQSIGAFGREVDRVQRSIDRQASDTARRMGRAAAAKARPVAYRVAARDLGGDPKFSGWRPWLELDIRETRAGVWIRPTRHSAGPWTVAEFGRNRGSGTNGAFIGPGANRKTGMTRFRKDGSVAKVRAFKSKRWNGYTQGKSTATTASDEIEKATAPIVEKVWRMELRKHFDVS